MCARWRWLSVVLLLMFWVVSGPVGMAFNGCAMMGAMCDAPCGMASYMVAPMPPDLIALQPMTYLAGRPAAQVVDVTRTPLEPPPKSALLSA